MNSKINSSCYPLGRYGSYYIIRKYTHSQAENVANIYATTYYSALKMKEMLSFTTNKQIMLNEISKEQEDKYHIISLICGV